MTTKIKDPPARTSNAPTGVVVQAWVPLDLEAQIKARAAVERRSVSSLIRNAVEDRLDDRGPA